MLGEIKSDQLFVEKIKLANNFHMENLSQSSWNKSPTNYKQQVISEKQKKTIVSNFYYPCRDVTNSWLNDNLPLAGFW